MIHSQIRNNHRANEWFSSYQYQNNSTMTIMSLSSFVRHTAVFYYYTCKAVQEARRIRVPPTGYNVLGQEPEEKTMYTA